MKRTMKLAGNQENQCRKRIGILLSSTSCDGYLYDTVRELAESGEVEVLFLLNRNTAPLPRILRTLKRIGLRGLIGRMVFGFIVSIERMIVRLISEASAPPPHPPGASYGIDGFSDKLVELTPIFSRSGLTVRYSDEDIEKIESLNLDLMIRGNAGGIFKGGILSAAREGVLSFHHGDNRWNRGGPFGFWEVYWRRPSTGFIIQILTEDLDGGVVVFRGSIMTRNLYLANAAAIRTASNPYMAKFILNYAATGRLPAPEESVPYGGPLLKSPTPVRSIEYMLRTWPRLAVRGARTRAPVIRRWRNSWGIAFMTGSWRGASLRRGVRIANPPGHYLADPFVVTRDGKTVCFAEYYSWRNGRGCIAAIELSGGTDYRMLGTAIDEPFHMSFPFLLEYGSELYMVPETMTEKAIRIYRCVEFPMKWEFHLSITLGEDEELVDAMVFEKDGVWWILANRAEPEEGTVLLGFYSDSPLSRDWAPSELNPMVFDSETGRNGGILDAQAACPIRVRQRHGFGQYGAGASLARITDLTPTTFEEREIGTIETNFFPGIKGFHHLHSNGEYTVYDYFGR